MRQQQDEPGRFSICSRQAAVVRKDAAFAVSMNGATVIPGDSKDITIDFGQGDGILIPIFPATSGKVGESRFMIELPQIQ
ncbi:hypothetical protein D8W73_22005 [Citrobacter amalonaticus]|uniref:hypothetical protein n=1 Tax=Enterobacter hormaechei TaxID=158836 RepID=UPI00106CBFBC|nr:hypothetical protein [Enterobacter hormaechei]EAP5363886.1 hypothetical protein [Salmonella enterica]EGT4256707.1 hypothetical protein [Citrobacter amalonaticus]MDZ6813436.1 hypothetical protein [Escherichia coli]EBQ4353789.1 hypothetical protein [Salmonella enterica]MEA3665078.1 hypothetical protein [Enterobacter hormaechei]